MDHDDHVSLLRPAGLPQGGFWADLGAGSGAFTLALSELVGLGSEIYAIDRDKGALSKLEQLHRARFGTSKNIHIVRGDFTVPLSLPPLDGVLMANSLHFYREKEKVLRHVRKFLEMDWQARAGRVQRGFRQSLGASSHVVRYVLFSCPACWIHTAKPACKNTLPFPTGVLFGNFLSIFRGPGIVNSIHWKLRVLISPSTTRPTGPPRCPAPGSN